MKSKRVLSFILAVVIVLSTISNGTITAFATVDSFIDDMAEETSDISEMTKIDLVANESDEDVSDNVVIVSEGDALSPYSEKEIESVGSGEELYPSITLMVPYYDQKLDGDCGISSLSMIEAYCNQNLKSYYAALGVSSLHIDYDKFYDAFYEGVLQYSHSLDRMGKVLDIGNIVNSEKYVSIHDGNRLENIYKELQNGNPVLIYRGKDTKSPHWSVIYGYDGSPNALEKQGFKVKNTAHPTNKDKEQDLKTWLGNATWDYTYAPRGRCVDNITTRVSELTLEWYYPENIMQGKLFPASGLLISPGNITSVEYNVKDSAGNIKFKDMKTFAPNASYFGLANGDKNAKFSSLSNGKYTYYVRATDDRGSSLYQEIQFTVSAANTTAQKATFTATAGGSGGETPPTPGPTSDSVAFSSLNTTEITHDNARISAELKDVSYPTEIGFYLSPYKNMTASCKEKETKSGKEAVKSIWYNVNKTVELKANTTYYWQIYVIVDGKEYKSDVQSFATKNLEKSSLTVECTKPSGNLSQGSYFTIKGSVQSNYNITSVKAVIEGSGYYVDKEVKPNAKSYSWGSGSELDKAMNFHDLKPGKYTFALIVKDASDYKKTVSSNFTIVEKEDVKATEKPSIVLDDSKDTLSETAAVRTAVIKNPGRLKISEAGMTLCDASGAAIARCSEQVSYPYAETLTVYYGTDSQTGTNLNIKLIPGMTYTYEIFAKIGNDNYSAKGSFTTLGSSKPKTPKLNISKTEYSVGDIATVTWEDVEYAVNGYTVTLSRDEGDYTKTISTKLNSASFTMPEEGDYQISIIANGYSDSDKGVLNQGIRVLKDPEVTFVQITAEGSTEVLKKETVKCGGNATPPAVPSRTGWVFQGWDKPYTHIEGDVIITAQFVRNIYTVKFWDGNGNVIGAPQRVEYGGAATLPAEPQQAGYVFVGWSNEDYKYVTKNTDVYASYVYANKDLPIQLQLNGCAYGSDEEGKEKGYTIKYTISNYDVQSTSGRVVVAIKAKDGRLIQTTESNAFTLKKSQSKNNEEIFVPEDNTDGRESVEAATAEVVIVQGYKKSLPISEKKTINVERSWIETTTKPSENIANVETITEYRFRDRHRNTFSSTDVPGWTYEWTEAYWSDYGAWSDWSRNQYYNSDSRIVESRTVTDTEAYSLQQYYYYRYWHTKYNGWYYSYANRSGESYASNVSYQEVWLNSQGDSRTATYVEMDDGHEKYRISPYLVHQIEWFYKGNTQYVPAVTHTEWRCRDRQILYRYHMYQWSGWTDWSTTPVSASDDRQVETQIKYRYKANEPMGVLPEGTSRTYSGKVSANLAGKQALLFVYKHEEPSDSNNEYLGQTTIALDGSYSFTFITREEPTAITGDFTLKLGIEGASELIYIGKIDAPKANYKVTFLDWDGKILSDQTVKEGNSAVAPENPEREGYRFTGWNTGLTNVHDDMEIMAVYARKQCSVVFMDSITKAVKTEIFDMGSDIVYPAWNDVEGYDFVGWLDENGEEISTVDRNLVLTATYKVKSFPVIFYAQSGEILSKQDVLYGEAAIVPEIPMVEFMRFVKWSTYDYTSVTEELHIYPTYEFYETTPQPTASVKSTILSEAITVELSCEDREAGIYYTLDGAEPDINSTLYTAPITIDKNVVLKFFACSSCKNNSAVVSEAYLMQTAEDDAGALVIKKDNISIVLGEEAPSIGYFLYHEDADMGVTFYSLNEDVVSVDQAGQLTANQVGGTQVYVVTNDYRYADYCDITVTSNEIKLESLSISDKKMNLVVGEEADLSVGFYPKNATYQDILWTSDNKSVVKVNESGHLIAKGAGGTYVTAYSHDGANIAYCFVTVEDTSIQLNVQEITLAVGEKYQLKATVKGNNSELTWKSNNIKVATVSTDGLVSAVSGGIAEVLVMDSNGDFRTCIVRVTSGEINSENQPVNKTDIKIRLADTTATYTYTGTAIKPDIIVTNNGKKLLSGTDYTVKYTNNINANDDLTSAKAPTITVTGKGNLTGSASLRFAIEPKNLEDEDVAAADIVTVDEDKASPQVYYNGMVLKNGKDYTFGWTWESISESTGEGLVFLISGEGNYSGDIRQRVIQKDKADLNKFTAKAVIPDKNAIVYDGSRKTVSVEVYDSKDKTKLLSENQDYVLVYGNNVNAGTASVTVVGTGSYTGTKKLKFTIKPSGTARVDDSGLAKAYTFNAGAVTVDDDLRVTDAQGNMLTQGVDYKVTYSANKKVGTAKYKVTFLGNYKATKAVTKTFTITQGKLSDANADIEIAVGDMAYSGKAGTYKSNVYVTLNGIALKKSDYTVAYYKDAAHTQEIKTKADYISLLEGENAATVYVKVTGKGNFAPTGTGNGSTDAGSTGTDTYATASYKVVRNDSAVNLNKVKITVLDEKGNKLSKAEYTGHAVTPQIKVEYKDSATKTMKTLSADQYKIQYQNNVNKGKATIVLTGNGIDTVGSKTATFIIASKNLSTVK